MRRLLASFFMIGAICFATWTGNGAIAFAAEGGGDATALQADNALQLALRKKDAKAVSALLDRQFSWTLSGAWQVGDRASVPCSIWVAALASPGRRFGRMWTGLSGWMSRQA